ncbi:LCP family protein [Streptomyces goshikiensis]|uniref:LCP family protein n=1 Tax=Streptomyces TaxID=1883 RepID=UPI000F555C43|nr:MULTISPECIES: LCP family protein [Streptomyces]RPK51120.1 putative transcriptional regulator YwtF [Streptomyces sp. ADI91-18]WBY20488.1 LCP family protein [Streptomyces goshikiensis]WSR99264.1 LCP family protein [Streptomyces goshikiensis]WSX99711.1 LCP family protein [Streptomyces goshikiensis]
MDAQSRRRADEIDPADQWVLNPRTGNYELRLDSSAAQQTQQQRPSVGAPRRTRTAPAAPAAPEAPSPVVPGPRRGDGPPGGRRGGRSRRIGGGGRKKALMITGGTLAFLLVGGSLAAYLYYDHLNGNLNVTDIGNAGSGGFKKDQPINILVIGTDKRSGAGNEGYGDKDSVGHADTTILFHVSKDRSNATALSIPRDLITSVPDCPTKQPDGSTKNIPGEKGTRFNTSLGQSGRDPGCTMRTVKEITGIQVDHFMMVDFNAVKNLSTAVGGVPVCLEKDVNDKDSKLKLSAGEHRLAGEDALAFVRTRHAFGNQSDLDRIKTQQQFLGSMMREMKSKETLTSPKKFLSLAEVATKSLTVDSGIGSIDKLTDLAGELKDMNLKNISFTTLPVVDNPAEKVKATVVVNQAQADPLLQMIRGDVSLTEVEKKEKAAKESAEAQDKAKQDALLQGEKAPAGDVRVDIRNGGGPAGSASTTLNWLQNSKGVNKASNLGNAPAKIPATQLEFAPNQAAQARALADMMGLPATALKVAAADAGPKTPMKLTLGADFKGAGIALNAPTEAPEGVQRVEADKAICAK